MHHIINHIKADNMTIYLEILFKCRKQGCRVPISQAHLPFNGVTNAGTLPVQR